MPDYDFTIEPGPQETNSFTARLVTTLTQAEEARFRELLATAWDEGFEAGEINQIDGYWGPGSDPTPNPYRLSPTGDDSDG